MSPDERKQTRMKGTRNIVLAAQEFAWAAGTPLTRVDWQPNPELEREDALSHRYLLSLSSNSRRTKHEVTADWLEKAAAGVDTAIREEVGKLVAQLKKQSA